VGSGCGRGSVCGGRLQGGAQLGILEATASVPFVGRSGDRGLRSGFPEPQPRAVASGIASVGGEPMARNKVEICGVDTSKLPVLKNEEMRTLFRSLQEEGDLSAREKLVNGNLRLVLSVIQRFNNRGENEDDLFQVD